MFLEFRDTTERMWPAQSSWQISMATSVFHPDEEHGSMNESAGVFKEMYLAGSLGLYFLPLKFDCSVVLP